MRIKWKKSIFGGIFFAFLAITIFILSSRPKAPDLTLTTLDGQSIALAHLQGKPVIVTFWATDCESCLKEIPVFLDLYSRYHSQGLEIIGVSMYYDPPNHVIEFNKQHALPYPIVLDIDGTIANAFENTRVTPTTFLLTPSGEIGWKKTGLFELTQIQPKIDAFLGK
jgi:peroxiredoxin